MANNRSVLITGLPRAGKSMLQSVFVDEGFVLQYRSIFSAGGMDRTRCPVVLTVLPMVDGVNFVFYTDNGAEEIYVSEDNLPQIKARVDDVFALAGEDTSNYIEVFGKPNKMLADIMSDTGVDEVSLFDLPSYFQGTRFSELFGLKKVDLTLLVVRSENIDHATETLDKLDDILFGTVSTEHSVMLCNVRGSVDDYEEYQELLSDRDRELTELYSAYKKIANTLRVSIKAEDVLAMPSLNTIKLKKSDEVFCSDLFTLIRTIFELSNVSTQVSVVKPMILGLSKS